MASNKLDMQGLLALELQLPNLKVPLILLLHTHSIVLFWIMTMNIILNLTDHRIRDQ